MHAERELIHQVNNLLGVIYTQVAVVRATGSMESAQRALELIERAARDTGVVVERSRQRPMEPES